MELAIQEGGNYGLSQMLIISSTFLQVLADINSISCPLGLREMGDGRRSYLSSVFLKSKAEC